ncbi:methanol dehydrogenase [cytochrome c] subunit [Methyloraptor flagellatus]|uniref:Methanol dehydrogenase [cytochrome c] subunit n=1 Tax=Methyloraptor flagellatus TaxID=3162530 RepID=A0AAU7X8Y9_9HYPH
MEKISTIGRKAALILAGAVLAAPLAVATAVAYDGTNCKAPGNCWEPKPGYPATIAGTKYDPKHDPKEISKQAVSIEQMEERNRKRAENFKKTGKFEYDVTKIPN